MQVEERKDSPLDQISDPLEINKQKERKVNQRRGKRKSTIQIVIKIQRMRLVYSQVSLDLLSDTLASSPADWYSNRRDTGTVYEADDEEADRIYDIVDAKIDSRRKLRREQREREEQEKQLKEKPTIQSQFADLKRGLADMSETDWESLRRFRPFHLASSRLKLAKLMLKRSSFNS